MDIEDIKVGETYNVRVKVVKKETARVCCHTISKNGNCFSDFHSWFSKAETAAFSPITPEPAPKYNPCRKFRKGDIVRVVEWNGRDIARVGQIGYVMSNEINSRVELSIDGWARGVYYPACNLELVTPVEELEPYYYVAKNDGVHPTFLVRNRNEEHRIAAICECWNEEDAQRICDMYNAEYRKGNQQ